MNIERIRKFAETISGCRMDSDWRSSELSAEILALCDAFEQQKREYADEITRRDEIIACSNKLIAEFRSIEATREQHAEEITQVKNIIERTSGKSLLDFIGAAPDFTGGEDEDEFMARMRDDA